MTPEQSLAFGHAPAEADLDQQPLAVIRQALHLAAESRADGRAAYLRRYLYERTSVTFRCGQCGHEWNEPPPERPTLWECPGCKRPVDTGQARRRAGIAQRFVSAAVVALVVVLGAPEPVAACETGPYLSLGLGAHTSGRDVYQDGDHSSDAIGHLGVGYLFKLPGARRSWGTIEYSHESDPIDQGDHGQERIMLNLVAPLGGASW